MRLTIIFSAIFLILISCDKNNKQTMIPVDEVNPESRIFKSLDLETYDLGDKIISPGFFDVANNLIFITDFKDYGIYKGELVTNNVNLNKIAGRKGSGPGEFEDISDIQIVENSILVSDENRARLSQFSLDGNFKESYIGKNLNVHRFIALDLNRVIVFSLLNGENIISVIDLERDSLLQEFFKKDKNLSPLIYEGKISSNMNDQIFYSGFSEPVLMKFSSEGKKLYSVNHVDSYSSLTNYVQFETGNGGMSYRYSPTAEFYTSSMVYFNDFICILVKKEEDKYVDFYNSVNGYYKYSIKVSSKAIELDTDDQNLYVLNLTMPNTSVDRLTL